MKKHDPPFLILKPKPDSPAGRVIQGEDPGVVGVQSPVNELMFTVCFEGNLHGAENLNTYEERVKMAADRLMTGYPTVARMDDWKASFTVVGEITGWPGRWEVKMEPVKYHLWIHIEKEEEGEDYGEQSEPEKIATFDTWLAAAKALEKIVHFGSTRGWDGQTGV
jgi:hypothetical protein